MMDGFPKQSYSLNLYSIQQREIPSWLYSLLSAVLISLGVVLRARQYFENRSLWLDEATLALNIIRRSFDGLLKPLDYFQGSPIGFLIIEKTFTQFLGDQEYVLRAFPMLAGIISLFLIFVLANYLLSRIGALFALSVFAFNGEVIYYAVEVKQYSTDVMVSLLLLVLAIPLSREGAKQKSQYLLWGFAAGMGIWLSHPALFVVAGISAALIFQARREKNLTNLRWLAVAILLWITSFFLNYLVTLRELRTNNILLEYWRDYYMPFPLWRNLIWLPDVACELFKWQLNISICWLAACLFLLGIVSFLWFKRIWGVILSTPFLIVLVVSSVQLYPFGQRPMLFSIPLVLLLITGGIEFATLFFQNKILLSAVIWILFAAFFLYQPIQLAYQNFADPPRKEDIKPILAAISESKKNGDLVCVIPGAKPAYDYYAPVFDLPPYPCILSFTSLAIPEQFAAELRVLSGSGRVWFIFSHRRVFSGTGEEEKFREVERRIGRRRGRIQSEGVAAYEIQLYRLR